YYGVDAKKLVLQWLSEKIYQEIKDEEYGLEALQLAESRVAYKSKLFNNNTLIKQADELKAQLDQKRPLSKAHLAKLMDYYKVEYTYDSNRIEGNTMTLKETALVIEKGLTISGKSVREHFETVNHVKWPLLKKAATNFLYQASGNSRQVYNQFCDDEAHWLFDYSLFMAVKEKNELRPWWQWPVEQKLRYQEAIDQLWNELNVNAELYRIIQFFFYSQWLSVKKYANERGIKIIGDIPLYIAHDSADAWCNPSIFMFDGNRNPIWVAGVPPDYFSETGQLWGNPLYNWEVLKSTGFRWWIDRVKANLKLYDIVRIDHFRGLCAYWAVPFGETTAIRGEWINAAGREMLEAIGHELGELNLIAEDLGVITPDVVELREGNNLPGMKILQFAFDSADDNDFRPHTYTRNCIVYTGTHDNDTTAGWYKSAKNEDLQSMRDYFEPDEDHIHWAFIRLAWSTVAGIAIAPAQDILGLGTECRMNLPGKPSGYWRWRLLPGQLTETHANQLARLTRIFGR
ncbi:MAG: 4-alpha-glucanotransferase, partial [Bacteroidetes bacterium HGW-Bacteroidetes-22]